jgi:hypothetical protein
MPLEPAIVPAAVSSYRTCFGIKKTSSHCSPSRTGRPREGVRRPAKSISAKKPSWTKVQANEKGKQNILRFVHF